jgi:hypothetical protein
MLRFFLKLSPVALLVAAVITPIYDWVQPPSFVNEGLTEYEGQWRLCLGASSRIHYSDGELADDSYRQRVYLLFPRVFSRPAIIVVSYFPGRGTVSTDETIGGLLFVVVVLAMCAWATWKWWISPLRELGWEKFRETV